MRHISTNHIEIPLRPILRLEKQSPKIESPLKEGKDANPF